MGRWAQRRVAGGGIKPNANGLLQIINATVSPDGEIVTTTWSGTVNPIDFAAADFLSSPSDTEPNNIGQENPNQLDLEYASDIRSEDFIRYIGSTPGILTPQIFSL